MSSQIDIKKDLIFKVGTKVFLYVNLSETNTLNQEIIIITLSVMNQNVKLIVKSASILTPGFLMISKFLSSS